MIALIGQGRMAKAHARAFSALDCSIRYVCTPHPGAPLTDAPGAMMVTDLETVLADDLVTIVVIATPTPSHASIAIRALAAGKNVLLEKPIALTVDDARAIRTAAAVSSGTLMVAHVVRFFPGYQKLRQARDDGSLGSVLSVRASRMTAHNPTLSWIRDDALSGGMLVDFAIHDFDQLNLFLGTPISVNARRSGMDGPVETTVEYEGGRLGSVQSFNGLPIGTPLTSSLDVVGSAGLAGYRYPSDPAGLDYSESLADPFVQQAEYFLRCVASREAPNYCPLDAAITALSVSLAARESLLMGVPVPVVQV